MKQVLDFCSLDEVERKIFLEDTWCDKCSEADLGMINPELYIEDARKFISGNCAVCGTKCISEIVVKIVD
ncbi:hypothetical protein [Paraglaciecola sp.]|uniref:hypothetical protein n=1 Tax=Paraglaciecola sp. TaxID=1920173 RepID=UPI0032674325